MARKLGRFGILTAVTIVLLLAIMCVAFFYPEVGMAKTIGGPEPRLSENEYSTIPQSVIADATRLAKEMVGNSQKRFQDLQNQILATYIEARNSDVVVVFNPGGWGWNPLDETTGWSSILEGIESQLDNSGYRSLVLNYQRTSKGLRGCIKEFVAMATGYPAKARDLAERVKFLTDHIPNLKVIIAGESTGTVISDETMGILQNNTKVYSIQTGTPFWHKPVSLVRTLLMNSNGKTIDTFSCGKVPAVIWATVKGWLGLSSTKDNPGRILSWLRAPGHDYSWQYPEICSEIVRFLTTNFGDKR
jgi:hypothetical protein